MPVRNAFKKKAANLFGGNFDNLPEISSKNVVLLVLVGGYTVEEVGGVILTSLLLDQPSSQVQILNPSFMQIFMLYFLEFLIQFRARFSCARYHGKKLRLLT